MKLGGTFCCPAVFTAFGIEKILNERSMKYLHKIWLEGSTEFEFIPKTAIFQEPKDSKRGKTL